MTEPLTFIDMIVTTGSCTAITIAVVKTDVAWLKASVSRAHKRVDELQKQINNMRFTR